MTFEPSEKAKQLQARLKSFMDAHVYPNERRFYEQLRAEDRWRPLPLLQNRFASPVRRHPDPFVCSQ